MRRVAIIILTIIVSLVLFIVLFTFCGREYEHVMLDRFGHLVKPKNIAYGWYLCWPTDRVVRLDKRLHLYQSALEQTITGHGDTISFQIFAAWRITDPVDYYTSTGGHDLIAQKNISEKIVGVTKNHIGGYALEALFNTDSQKVKSHELEEEIRAEVNKDLADVNRGVGIDQIGFARMAFPPDVAKAVYSRMTAERDTQAEKFRSDGATVAETIKSQGKSTAATTLADARRTAEDIKTDADKQALAMIAEAQSSREATEFYAFLKSIDLFKNAMTNRTILLLQSDRPIPDQIMPLPPAPPGPVQK